MLRFEDNGDINALAEVCLVNAVLENGAVKRLFLPQKRN
jgi:hypothetical protein